MNTTEILQQLRHALEWVVLFRLDAIRPFADDTRIRAMYYLPDGLDLTPYTHVVLTSTGRFLAPRIGKTLWSAASDGEPVSHTRSTNGERDSLYSKYQQLFTLFPPDEADCVGFGRKGDLPPVLLHLVMKEGCGEAKAIFRQEPLRNHYELLRAVGVEYLGGEQKSDHFVATFRNKLPVHLQAGAMAHFSRTGNCNTFFFAHGEIDSQLEAGLIQASNDRAKEGLARALAACELLGRRALLQPMAMTCCPPPPAQPFPYGDLVPLGFLSRALNLMPSGHLSATRSHVQQKLLANRNGEFWAFHTGRLVTATDSVLILRGLLDASAIEALERFADGQGGYYPQLWSDKKEPGRMVRTEAVSHWCQSDFGTTCLVRALRAQTGLTEQTPLSYLEENFERRAGLYFANPYLADWALAEAIRCDESAGELKARLLAELLASLNEDFSLGQYDVALSTSLAILTMAALGFRGRTMRLAQLRLLEMIEPSGVWPESTPFYSTYISNAFDRPPQFLKINSSIHELSLYRDSYRMIGTALAAEALAEACSPSVCDIARRKSAHPRYRCVSHEQYIAEFALPRYVGELVTR